jgi:hypothetical protein
MNPGIKEGFYKNPMTQDVYKVLYNKAMGNGRNLYAKRLVPETGRFMYSYGAIHTLQPDWQMSLEDMKSYGKQFGRCCLCGRTLTDDVSISLGIGPICERRYKLRQAQPADETPENQ